MFIECSLIGKELHSHSKDLLINKYINFEKGHYKDIVKDHLIVLNSKAKNIEHDPILGIFNCL